jgi:transcriptional regulator with XRE-family HTH domain
MPAQGPPRDVTIPAQIRAGRALLDWSQVQLAAAAGIGVSSVKAFESGRPGKELSAAGPLRVALEGAGIVFLSGDERDGPGVRLVGTRPNIIRQPLERDFYEQVNFTVEWRGQSIHVQVPGDVLDALDELAPIPHQTAESDVASFDRHRAKILAAIVAAASNKDRFRPNQGRGVLQLVPGDFPALR